MSRRSLAARIGAQTTTGGVVVVADTNQYRLLEDKHRLAGPPPGRTAAWPCAGLRWRPHPPRSTGHTPNEPGRAGSEQAELAAGRVAAHCWCGPRGQVR